MKNDIFLGADIGATKTIFLATQFYKNRFKVLDITKCPTLASIRRSSRSGPHKESEILKTVEENYKILAGKYKFSGIGIGFAGPVNHKKGAAISGPNLKTGKIEFKKNLERRLGIPVAVDNDAKCFVLAENVFGAAKGYKNIVGLTIGTGIGGGIIIDGKLYRGADNFAGEVGHTEIGKDIETEKTSSGRGLRKIYKSLANKTIGSFEIIGLAGRGDAKALETIDRAAKVLGMGIASLIELLNPEIVILGGGLAEVGLIVNKAKKYAKKKVFLPTLAKTPIVVSGLGQNAVAVGAAWMVKTISN